VTTKQHHRPPVSPLAILGASLGAGVVLTVAVAWALAARQTVSRAGSSFVLPPSGSGTPRAEWKRLVDHIPVAGPAAMTEQEGAGLQVLVAMRFDGGSVYQAMRVRAGWPMRALGCTFVSEQQMLAPSGQGPTVDPPGLRAGLPIPAPMTDAEEYRRFPLMPVWPGFFVSVAVFTGAIAAPILGVGAIRRRRRP